VLWIDARAEAPAPPAVVRLATAEDADPLPATV
jgi:hypothetical protein